MHLSIKTPTYIALLSLLGGAATTKAEIIDFDGNASLGDISGADLRESALEGADVVGFDELSGVEIGDADLVYVDYFLEPDDFPGVIPGVNDPDFSTTLPSGTYDSHLLHFDAVGANGSVANATFCFDGFMRAILANTTYLNDSDSAFGAADFYDNTLGRRSESNDMYTLSSPRCVTVDAMIVANFNIDNLRVLTRSSTAVLSEICAGPWRNHGQCVSCVAHETGDLWQLGWLSTEERQELRTAAAVYGEEPCP